MVEEFYKEGIDNDKKEAPKESDGESIKDILKKNNALLERLANNTEGVKPLKLKKLGKGAKKKGFVNYLFIHENGEIEPLKVPIKEMTAIVDESPRLARPEEILSYKGSPTIIQPAWSSKPFSMIDNYAQTVKEKMLSAGYRLLALRAEAGDIKAKKKMSGWIIFFIVIALIVVGYLLLK